MTVRDTPLIIAAWKGLLRVIKAVILSGRKGSDLDVVLDGVRLYLCFNMHILPKAESLRLFRASHQLRMLFMADTKTLLWLFVKQERIHSYVNWSVW